jgi:hypothetical protein
MPDETLIDLLSRYPDPHPEPVDRPLPWAGALESSVFDPTWERDAKRALGLLVPTTPREVATELLMGAAAGPIGAAVSKVGGPVVRAIRRVVNPPFEKSKRETLGSMIGKDTLENIQRRKLLATGVDRYGNKVEPWALHRDPVEHALRWTGQEGPTGKGQPEGLWMDSLRRLRDSGTFRVADSDTPSGILRKEAQKAQDILSYTLDTQSKKPGILGEIIEHGKVLARKIDEEALEEAGEVIKEEAPGEETAKVVDAILRRWGIRGDR